MPKLCKSQLSRIQQLAEEAATCALSYYDDNIEVTLKSDDSPVTKADIAVSRLLEKELPKILDIPVLSEENKPEQPLWLDWQTYWLIDPIDGTRHFINRSGDFCICIALIDNHETTFGLICAPTTEQMWLGQINDQGQPHQLQKFHQGKSVPLVETDCERLTVVTGGYTLSQRMQILLSSLPPYDFYDRGSALKFIDIIEGRAHIYPKIWDICEWDCAAGQCLLLCSGGNMIRFDSNAPIIYGMQASLLSPHFLAYRGLNDKQIETIKHNYSKIPPVI